MTTPEALLTLAWSLIQLFGSICCLLAGITLWCFILRDRRIEREIKKMWATSKVIGNPLHQGAIREMAELLGVKLDDD